jgi:hypothetical protein
MNINHFQLSFIQAGKIAEILDNPLNTVGPGFHIIQKFIRILNQKDKSMLVFILFDLVPGVILWYAHF